MEWELLKMKIKDVTRSNGKQKSVHNRNKPAELYGNDTDSPLAANPECVATQTSVTRSKLKIELLEQQNPVQHRCVIGSRGSRERGEMHVIF